MSICSCLICIPAKIRKTAQWINPSVILLAIWALFLRNKSCHRKSIHSYLPRLLMQPEEQSNPHDSPGDKAYPWAVSPYANTIGEHGKRHREYAPEGRVTQRISGQEPAHGLPSVRVARLLPRRLHTCQHAQTHSHNVLLNEWVVRPCRLA